MLCKVSTGPGSASSDLGQLDNATRCSEIPLCDIRPLAEAFLRFKGWHSFASFYCKCPGTEEQNPSLFLKGPPTGKS